MGGGPRLDRRARIQLGRVHFGVFSTSRFVPPALSSHWTWPDTFRYWRGVTTDLWDGGGGRGRNNGKTSLTRGHNWPFRCLDKMPVSIANALVFPLLMIDQHNTFSFWKKLPNKSQDLSIQNILYSQCCMPKNAFFPFLTLEQHTTFKESMINRLSNLINRNRSEAKISQVLCSSGYPSDCYA